MSKLNALRFFTGTLMLGGALTLGLYGLSTLNNQSFADDDDDDDRRYSESSRYSEKRDYNGNRDYNENSDYRMRDMPAEPPATPGTSLADAEQYRSECGSCHMPYPAKFLPARSWQAIMTSLDDHFGEDASVTPAMQAELLAYLSANSPSNHSRFMARLGYNETPMRITELPYFKRKHSEIPERLVSGNPQVGSFSQCDSCHKGAAQGKFNEHTVDIPGFGRWDD